MLTVWLLLVSLMYVSAVEQQPTCSSKTVKITMKNTRNKTGHWSSVVAMNQASKEVDLWLVDLEQSSSVCEGGTTTLDTVINISAGGGPPRKIPAGYELFSGVGYYKFHPNGTTWPQARHICAEEGAHLAVINSETEADVIVQLFARFPKPLINAAGNEDWAWVGVHEMGVDGEYYTVFGDALNTTGYMRWQKGQPDDKAVDTAVVSHRISGGLGDAFPAWTAAFICEVDI